MKLLFLIGDTAVGKMTVGQELMKITPPAAGNFQYLSPGSRKDH